jgi:arginine-tRNA-protein transferase
MALRRPTPELGDAERRALSAIYFFHDPCEHKRSLGTLNILHLIERAVHRGMTHVYLGYYVEGYRSLEYKARFRPNEVFTDAAGWKALIASPSAGPID